MKKTYRILALIFALLMVFSCFVGCKKNKGGETATTTVSSGDVSDPNGSKLPAKDWQEAVFMVLGDELRSFEIARDEMPEDAVGKAVYERNDALRQKYNFIVDEVLVKETHEEMNIRYGASEDLYDAVLYRPTEAANHAQEGYLLDLSNINYIDLTHPSWNQYATQEMTIANKVYFTVSDFLLSDKNRYFVLHYNRELARSAGKGYLEDMVDSNTWTFDNFNALVQEFSDDGDGDGQKGGIEDYYGIACESYGSYSVFLYGGGFRLSNNVDGKITMAGAGDNVTKVINKSASFALKKDVTYYPDDHHTEVSGGSAYGTEITMFTGKRALFFSAFLSVLDTLQEKASFERAYMPFPKYDTTQTEYYTMINHLGAAVITVPYTVQDKDKAGYMLQAVTEFSTNTTYAAYFEQKCKLQGSVDQRASDMLDLIFENVVFDLAYIYDFAGLRTYLLGDLPKTAAYARYNRFYGNKEETANNKIEEITAAYQNA